MLRFPIVIHHDPGSGYGVTVPDIPGCFSAGDTPEEAIINAREAIECHVEGLLIDGDPFPSPGKIEDHRCNPDYANEYCWSLVDVDLSKVSGEVKRVNISLPSRILTMVDSYVEHHNSTRSGFFAQLALERIIYEKESLQKY